MDKKKIVKTATKATNKVTTTAPKKVMQTTIKKSKPPLEEFTLPIKKRKIFKKKPPKIQTIFGYRTGQKVQMTEKGKPIIPFKRKIANIIKGRKYDKDGVEVQETLKSRLMKFAKKRGKKTVKKQFKKQIKNWWGSLQGVSKVAVISIGGVGITAAVAVPTVLANTIWKADNYKTQIASDYSKFITIGEPEKDGTGNLLFSLSINKPGFCINNIASITKGDYKLAHEEGATQFEDKKHEYSFDLNSKKVTIYKNVIGTHKGDIVITPALLETSITSIKIKSNSTHKTTFSVGETFSSDGLILEITYKDGQTKDTNSDITTDHDSASAFAADDAGKEFEIIVFYKGNRVGTYNIRVESVQYDKTITDSDNGFKYSRIKGTNNWVIQWDGVTLLDRNTTITCSPYIHEENIQVIGIKENGFKNAQFKSGEGAITLTISDALQLQYIGAGAFDNSAITNLIIDSGDELWTSKDNNEAYVLRYNDETRQFTSEQVANLFKGEIKDKLIFKHNQLSFGVRLENYTAQAGVKSGRLDSNIIQVPASIKINNDISLRVDSIIVNQGSNLDGVAEINIPYTVESIGEDFFNTATDKLKKVCIDNPYYWCIWVLDEGEWQQTALPGDKLADPVEAAAYLKTITNSISLDSSQNGEIYYKYHSDINDYYVYHNCNDNCNLLKNVFIEEMCDGTVHPIHIKRDIGNEGAFEGCNNMTSIVLPRSLKSIDANAFSGCTALNRIYFAGRISEWKTISKGNNWHSGVPTTKVICFDGTADLDAAA